MAESNATKIYKCDICGKQSQWDDDWQYYSSLILEEELGDRGRVYACSTKCRTGIDPERALAQKSGVSTLRGFERKIRRFYGG